GVTLWRARAGNKSRTALLVSRAMPELGLDVLAAVELAKALGERHDFSPGLARALLKELDRRSATANPMRAVGKLAVRRAAVVLGAVLLLAASLIATRGHRLSS